jgi:Na+/phosphate symporter
MSIFNFLSLWRAALFLFGMGVMGEGLERRAEAAKKVLEKLNDSPFKGFFGSRVTR